MSRTMDEMLASGCDTPAEIAPVLHTLVRRVWALEHGYAQLTRELDKRAPVQMQPPAAAQPPAAPPVVP